MKSRTERSPFCYIISNADDPSNYKYKMSRNGAVEVLPPGVGRVPKWWMECTPHDILDLDEEEERERQEQQMAAYFRYMAKLDDAGLIGPDGSIMKDGAGSGGAGTGGWGGRSSSSRKPIGGIDPKLFGMDESHPDYHAVLTGAKLPPGYEEMMAQYKSGEISFASDLNSSGGVRGGAAGSFTPSWAKKKLRSTQTGSQIRLGKYSDSPSDTMRRMRGQTTNAVAAAAVVTPDKTMPEQAPTSHNEFHPDNIVEYEEYEEEIVSDEEEELEDLQAILAAKQAELARLQAQLQALSD